MRPIRQWRGFRSDERGEAALEYALIVAALAIAILATVFALADVLGKANTKAADSAPPIGSAWVGDVDQS